MSEQCSWLIDELDLALEATLNLAPDRPRRDKTFWLGEQLDRKIPKNGPERQLEWEIFSRWGLRPGGQEASFEFWQRLVGFQIPVYDNRLRNRWDKIDLVGIDCEGLPVVIELKDGSSDEKPLRPLLEAAGYIFRRQ